MATKINIRRSLCFAVIACLPFVAARVHAQTSTSIVEQNTTEQNGVSIASRSPDDFASDSFKESVKNAADDGVNTVSLVIPYYQSDDHSSDIQKGAGTPTDDALISAIDYIHSLGLRVALKPHLDAWSGGWRAFIHATNRNLWYENYSAMLDHLGDIGRAHHVEEIVVGTELIGMASSFVNGDNGTRWATMIADLRTHYSGLLTYSANWGVGQTYANEFQYIDFWPNLDMIGISAYFELQTDGVRSLASLEQSWRNIDRDQIEPLAKKYGKPVLFTEVGYKSVVGAHIHPWDSEISGNSEDPNYDPLLPLQTGGFFVGEYDGEEQVKDFEALFGYWKARPYFAGILLWNWSSDPSYGGPGNLDYTVRGKPAEDLLKQEFAGRGNAVKI